jgi:hypothetical protein
MSASCQKQTFCAAAELSLFDHLVGAASSDVGTARPSALAVFRLIVSWYFAGPLNRQVSGFCPVNDLVE